DHLHLTCFIQELCQLFSSKLFIINDECG
ncbi:hypothetical protein D043_1780B, partial [Vibrio parahaemolyticus EKP-021]